MVSLIASLQQTFMELRGKPFDSGEIVDLDHIAASYSSTECDIGFNDSLSFPKVFSSSGTGNFCNLAWAAKVGPGKGSGALAFQFSWGIFVDVITPRTWGLNWNRRPLVRRAEACRNNPTEKEMM